MTVRRRVKLRKEYRITMKWIKKVTIFVLVFSVILSGLSISVNVKASSKHLKPVVTFSVDKKKIKMGEFAIITIYKKNVKGSMNIKIKSSNENILQVQNELVLGVNPGTADIIIKYNLNGKRKSKKIKFRVVKSNNAVAVTKRTAFDPYRSHYNEEKLQSIMAGYDNPDYFDFNNYPNKIHWNAEYVKDSYRYLINKEWQTLPAYIRGAVIYCNVQFDFTKDGGYGISVIHPGGIIIGDQKPDPACMIGVYSAEVPQSKIILTFTSDSATIWSYFAKQYTKLKVYDEYKENPNKYGESGSSDKHSFLAEKMKCYVREHTDLFDETLLRLRIKDYPIKIYKRDLRYSSVYYAYVEDLYDKNDQGTGSSLTKTWKDSIKELCKSKGYEIKMVTSAKSVGKYEFVAELD